MNITHNKVQPFTPLHHHTFLFSSKSFPLPRKFTPASIKKSPSFPSILYKKHTFLGYGCFGVNRSRIRSSLSEVEEEQKQKPVVVKRAYPFNEIEPKWQRYWEENRTFRTPDDVDTSKPKYYVLDMFPYPRSFYLILTVVLFLLFSKNVQVPIYLFLKTCHYRTLLAITQFY